MSNIYLLGGGGHGKAIIDMIVSDLKMKIKDIYDDTSTEPILGYPVKKFKNEGFTLLDNFHISIGNNSVRKKISEQLKVNYPTLIHPTCVFSKFSTVKSGTVIMANTSIKAETKIGKHCIINAGAIIGHDITIHDYVHIAPNASVAGFVTIGEGTHIGIGSSIIQGIHIGKWAIIGAGAVIIKDVPDYAVVVGNPGVIKKFLKNDNLNQINPKKNNKAIEGKKKEKSFLEFSEYKLNCHGLKTEDDINTYKKQLIHFKGFDAFYKPELFSIKNTEEEKLKYFTLTKNDETLFLMPFSLRKIIIHDKDTTYKDVSSFYGYSGPLYNEKTTPNDLVIFWDHVDNWYRNNKVISEFIRFNLEGNYTNYSGKIIPTLNNVKGDILEDKDEQWNDFASKVRNNYRKAISNNLEAKIYHKNIDESVIEIFHEIYINTMKRNQAENNYFFSLTYFKNLILSNINNTALILIYKDNTPISTELILLNKETMYSFLGGTVASYFELRPNDFLKMEAMNWGRKNGCKKYILGGGRTNNDSLYKYKKSFFPHTDDVIYYTGRKILNERAYEKLVTLARKHTYTIDEADIENEYFPLYRK